MTGKPGTSYGTIYVCYRVGSRSHLCVSDKKNLRLSFCGLRFRRNGVAWNSVRWESITTKSRVTCRACLDVLSGRTYYKEEQCNAE
jgi:hypothetical protein